MERILILNGPNINLQGHRNPSVYGKESFDDLIGFMKASYPNITVEVRQSNIEGELIDALHASDGQFDGVIFNAGGYTHTSVALRDAIEAISTPVVEVHISSILAREEFRHISMIAPVCVGSIMGFGMDSYRLGVEALLGRQITYNK